MTYAGLLELLEGRDFHRCATFNEAEITNFVAGDLMSDILTIEDENFILITSLSSEQAMRTADIVGARGILLVNDKVPNEGMRKLAREFNISILNTPHRMFTTCYILGRALTEEGNRL